ncbi:MAG TPA: nitroreductase [Anaerolineales bacterium]|nr:nitroreductase [Anaerolineales bacterium]
METLEAIRTRVSAGKMSAEPVAPELVEQLLEAGAQAPNHYKVRPWRFVVLSGAARERLGDVMAQVLQGRFPDVSPEALQKERLKPLRSPVIIAVGVDAPEDPRVKEIENICAAAAACENILLAAHALGLAAHWRTGDAARDPQVKRFLGLSESQQLIAFLYIGHAEAESPVPTRPGYEDRTTWVE